ncbi:MAG: energy transducer TonB [Candidatus Acidiferrum sp.]
MLIRPIQKLGLWFLWLSVFLLFTVPSSAHPDTKPVRVTISGKVMAQKVKTKVAPIYPAQAKSKGIQGTVRLHVLITTTGAVTQVQPVTGEPALVRSAMEAVKQWVYQPTIIDGQPVEVDTVIEVTYALKGS